DHLKALAEELNCCVLLVRHFRKAGTSKAIHKGAGSVGWVGSARSQMIVTSDPEIPTRKYLAHSKSNLTLNGDTLVFELSKDNEPPFKWLGVSKKNADQLIDRLNGGSSEVNLIEEQIIEMLTDLLQNGPVSVEEVMKLLKPY